ncbi:MAG: hypothetical protein ACRDF4_06125 [Rhabdochlamydiaceae bacterium]
MKAVLKSGLVLEGTPAEIAEFQKILQGENRAPAITKAPKPKSQKKAQTPTSNKPEPPAEKKGVAGVA